MRELEFLPQWYPQMRRRRRLVTFQAWMTVILVVGLGFWTILSHRNIQQASAAMTCLRGQMSQAEQDIQKLEELLKLQKQWLQQDQIVSRLGLPFKAARLLQSIDAVMPREMSLIGLNFETEEQQKVPANLAAARTAQDKQQPEVSRQLRVKLQAVAPTDVDLANFLAKLGSIPFFENLSVTYARERTDNGRLMREFEVSFGLSLDLPAGG